MNGAQGAQGIAGTSGLADYINWMDCDIDCGPILTMGMCQNRETGCMEFIIKTEKCEQSVYSLQYCKGGLR